MQAAAYAQYSTEHQTDSSIAYQMRKIEEYCDAHGITVSSCYADEAMSGTNPSDRRSSPSAGTLHSGNSMPL